jgi:hypothetical protein
VAEGARLEIVYTFIAYRGFESLSLRHLDDIRQRIAITKWIHQKGMRTREEGSTNLSGTNLNRAAGASPEGEVQGCTK